jgi:uncharacterized protein (DUF58 family)
MNATGIHPVSSKEHMLSPTDIFLVAAHEYKDGIQKCVASAKKHHISPERMLYSIMLKEYSDPKLIRVRQGNTLFTIAALPSRVGFIRGYNGDTAENYIENMIVFNQAARKMGFDVLVANTTPDVVRSLKLALRKHKITGIKSNFDSENGVFAITTGESRGE